MGYRDDRKTSLLPPKLLLWGPWRGKNNLYVYFFIISGPMYACLKICNHIRV